MRAAGDHWRAVRVGRSEGVKRQDSGIGLTLVHQIAATRGASVGIAETPGGSATVRLRF